MLQGEVIGWMAVSAIGVTFIVTILGIIGVLHLKPGYLKALYGLVLVELVGAGFFLFRMTFQPPVARFDPELPSSVYLFDAAGEPLPGTTLRVGDEVHREFPQMDENTLAPVTRRLQARGRSVVVTSESGALLGRVPDASPAVRGRFRSFQEELALGMHYAECSAVEQERCANRRDGAGSVRHLLAALGKMEGSGEERHRAVRQLFFVLDYFSQCEQFQQFVGAVETVRPAPPRYHELAEAYGEFARRAARTGSDITNARKAALKYYLTFLAETGVENNPLVAPSRRAALELSSLLEFSGAYLQAGAPPIEQALAALERQALGVHAAAIRIEPIGCS